MNKLKDMKERMREKKAKLSAIVTMTFLTMTTPVFAAGAEELQTGKNIGEWVVDQVWYIALAVCAVMLVKYIVQKAWVQCAIFLILSAICLFLISSPESLKTIGEKLFNMI